MATELTASARLRRYCFLGVLEPVYIYKKSAINVSTQFPLMTELCKDVDEVEIGGILADTLKLKTLVRRDEPIFLYATYLATEMENKRKTAARQLFTALIQDDDDLFLFCKYARLIHETLGRKGFSRTVRKAISSWYENQSPEVFESLFLTHRGAHGFTHKALIKLCHVTDTQIGNSDAAAPFFKRCTEILKTAESAATETTTKEVGDAEIPTDSPVVAISKLRTTADADEALKIMRKYKLEMKQVPHHFLSNPSIMEYLIKSLSGMELLKVGRVILRHNLQKNKKVLKIYQARLRKEKTRKQLHPVKILFELRHMESGNRLFPTTPREKRIRKVSALGLTDIYENSFGHSEPLGVRMHITINLQGDFRLKSIKNCRSLFYLEAVMSIAFGYFMQEAHADVFHFTENNLMVSKVPWTKTMKYAEAVTSACKIELQKHKQRLIAPLVQALKSDQSYDVFLVIVKTAGRSNPKHSSEFLCKFLEKYREQKNPNARFIILDLMKYKKSMLYSTTQNEHILEICGLDANTIDLINDFALRKFE